MFVGSVVMHYLLGLSNYVESLQQASNNRHNIFLHVLLYYVDFR